MEKINLIDNIDELSNLEICNILDAINNNKNNINKCNNLVKKCNICNYETHIIEDDAGGVYVCSECGQVVDFIVDSNPEWRYYEDGNNNDTERCSTSINYLLPQSSLSTSIGGNYKSKIKTLHAWGAMPYKERSLNLVLQEIQNKCSNGHILKCIEDDAKIMYKKISECKHETGKNMGKNIIIRGINRRSLIAACVFYACRRKEQSRSHKEIANIFNIKYTEMTKGCKTFLRIMKTKSNMFELKFSLPEHFIIRFCKELNIDDELIQLAIKISKNIQRLNIASVHTPISIASSSILLISMLYDLNIPKKDIAVRFNISEVTLIKTFKKIEKYKYLLIDDEKICKILDNSTILYTEIEYMKYIDNKITEQIFITIKKFENFFL